MSTTHPLRIARCLRNLTIKRLAQEAGVGASTIWRAEQDYAINAESRRRLCLYFGQSAQELGLVRVEQTSVLPHPISATPPLPDDTFTAAPVLPTISSELAQSSERSMGAWLKASALDLADLLDTDLSIDDVLDALRIVLQGAYGIPGALRQDARKLGAHSIVASRHISMEERTHLGESLRRSVDASWSSFHTARPTKVFVAAQAQLALVQQTHDLIFPTLRYNLYASLYDLIGAATFYQGDYDAARLSHRKAHLAALEGADTWNMAQSLNWQAIVASARGEYTDAIACIEAALRLAQGQGDEQFVRLRAHLFADWAYNASLLQDPFVVEEKLHASFRLLEDLGPNAEFDLTRWYQMKGNCMLMLTHYAAAIENLEYSLTQLPAPWVARRILTLIPLAEAYARRREREASIKTAHDILNLLPETASSMLNRRFLEYQNVLLRMFPRDHDVQTFVTGSRRTKA